MLHAISESNKNELAVLRLNVTQQVVMEKSSMCILQINSTNKLILGGSR